MLHNSENKARKSKYYEVKEAAAEEYYLFIYYLSVIIA
jgi:hypothetical protein